jgi:monofunctional glycosyltransferase
MLRILIRLIALCALAGLALVAAGGFLPLPSTLMLGRWILLKPVDRQWQPLERISKHLVHAVIASEDQRFCQHGGVDFDALREVMDDEDGPGRGASTITMQTVKNMYLWPGRSYIRKGIEIPLALGVDLLWGKRRVMEVYLNAAEFGDGVFGAEAAARRTFGIGAADLTPAQAARLAAALPNPLVRSPTSPSRHSRRVLGRLGDGAALSSCVRQG